MTRFRLTLFAVILAAVLWLDPIWAPLVPVGLFMPVFDAASLNWCCSGLTLPSSLFLTTTVTVTGDVGAVDVSCLEYTDLELTGGGFSYSGGGVDLTCSNPTSGPPPSDNATCMTCNPAADGSDRARLILCRRTDNADFSAILPGPISCDPVHFVGQIKFNITVDNFGAMALTNVENILDVIVRCSCFVANAPGTVQVTVDIEITE